MADKTIEFIVSRSKKSRNTVVWRKDWTTGTETRVGYTCRGNDGWYVYSDDDRHLNTTLTKDEAIAWLKANGMSRTS